MSLDDVQYESIRMLQMGTTSEDCLRDKRRSSRAANQTKNLYDIVYLASFGKKFISIVQARSRGRGRGGSSPPRKNFQTN